MIVKEAITAVILAGGKSQRMGKDKAFLKLGGTAFMERIICAVQPLVKEVIIIANKETFFQFGATVYPDRVLDKGPVGGIYSAMEVVQTPFLLVLSCDIPLISTTLLHFLIQNSLVCDVNLLTIKEQLQPLTAIYNKTTINVFKRALAREELKLRNVLKELNVQEIPCPNEYLACLANINTPNDFLNLSSMQIEIQYFGLVAEAIGKRNEMLSIKTPCSVEELQLFLLKTYPQLEGKRFKIAVNQQLVKPDFLISKEDEIALLPPFAGG